MDIGKIPPHDVEAEQAVIGSMLTDKEAVASSIEVLKALGIYNRKLKLYTEEKEKLENDIALAKKSKIIAKGSVYDGTIAEIENNQLKVSDLKNIIIHKKYNNIELDTGNGD